MATRTDSVKGVNMKAKLRKSTICFVMALAILFSMAPMQTHAAGPFWGASHLNAGTRSFEIPIDVNRPITRYTIKTWDFSGVVSLEVRVYNPKGNLVSSQVTYVHTNEEVPDQKIFSGGVMGTYKVTCTVRSCSGSGWVGAWLY